jgi:hypothetical protein
MAFRLLGRLDTIVYFATLIQKLCWTSYAKIRFIPCYVATIANIQDILIFEAEVGSFLLHPLMEGNSCANFLAKLGSTNEAKLST